MDINRAYRHSKWISIMLKRLKLTKKLLNPQNSSIIITDCANFKTITIPESVIFMGNSVFTDFTNFRSLPITIRGKAGSCVEKYAKERNLPFVAI